MLHVLLVEDDQVDQIAFERFVNDQKLPYQYSIAPSIATANLLLTQTHFQIIVLDYLLADGTAFDLLKQGVDASITIFITGVGDEDIALRALKSGVADYIVKDIKQHYLHILALTIDSIVQQKKFERTAQKTAADLMRLKLLNSIIIAAFHPIDISFRNLKSSFYLARRFSSEILIHGATENPPIDKIIHNIHSLINKYQYIENNYIHLEQLINNSIKLIKINNIDKIELLETDLGKLINQLSHKYYLRATIKKQTLNLELGTVSFQVAANWDEFAILLDLLLDSAFFYTAEHQPITIRLYSVEANICMEVIHRNADFSHDNINFIINKYDKIHSIENITFSSIELGLLIAKRIVDLHYGKFSIERNSGSDSTFKIIFPKYSFSESRI